jgi:hypothetical protein
MNNPIVQDVFRNHIINFLIQKNGYKTYLEIGSDQNTCFRWIKAEKKVSVDPAKNSKAIYKCTSNKFFETNTNSFDIIFIDGLHEWKQVYMDIINSLYILNEGGVIVCHDMNPLTRDIQEIPRKNIEWMGDCWKAWVKIRASVPDLTMHVVDTDCGCGVIQKGSQDLLKIPKELDYSDLDKNREKWLNLISVDKFKEIYL